MSSLEEVTSFGKLKVIPSNDPLFTRKLDILEVIEGRNARFDCKVSGTPSPKVTWSHFGRKAQHKNVYLIYIILLFSYIRGYKKLYILSFSFLFNCRPSAHRERGHSYSSRGWTPLPRHFSCQQRGRRLLHSHGP